MFQSLSAKDGYVPVYIRVGDTPLDQINPGLANAFNEENILGRNIATDVEAEMQADQPHSSSSGSSEETKDVEKKPTTVQAKSSEESAESNESKVTEATIVAAGKSGPEASAPAAPAADKVEAPAAAAEETTATPAIEEPIAIPVVKEVKEEVPVVAEEAKVEPTN